MIKRYEIEPVSMGDDCFGSYEPVSEDVNGDWCKVEDVEKLVREAMEYAFLNTYSGIRMEDNEVDRWVGVLFKQFMEGKDGN